MTFGTTTRLERHAKHVALAAALSAAVAGCTALLGIDGDYRPIPADAGQPEASALAAGDEAGAALADAALADATPPDVGEGSTNGSVADGPFGTEAAPPADVSAPAVPDAAAAAVVSVTAGRFHTCALFDDGTSKCWGRNDDYGELGTGTNVSTALPVRAMGTGQTALFAGAHDTCALSPGGVACAGRGDEVDVDGGSNAPVVVAAFPKVPVQVASGEGFTCGRTADGEVDCFGDGPHGELGTGAPGSSSTAVPVPLPAPATQIAAFFEHACALLSDGAVACWGDDTYGQIGAGSASDGGIAAPAVVRGIAGASAVGVGQTHSCALVDGGVFCWGANDNGQLGDGTGQPRVGPVAVSGIAGAGALAVGGLHTCVALAATGGVACWGKGGSGQLGNGAAHDELGPVPVTGIDGYPVSLSAGGFHTCALIASPVVRCWGSNDFGQIGNGSVDAQAAPAAVTW